MYDHNMVADMHARLSFGFPLTLDEQRWLWEAAARAERPPQMGDLGPLRARRRRCSLCDGAGFAPGESPSPPLYRPPCPACQGTGYCKVDDPLPAEAS